MTSIANLQPSEVTGASEFGSHFITTFRDCPMKWYNSYRRPHPTIEGGVGLDFTFTPVPLMVGWLTHQGLESYYRSGWQDGAYDLELAFEAVESGVANRAAEFQSPEMREDCIAQTRALLTTYHDWYGPGGASPDWPNLKVLHDNEGSPLIEREFRIDMGYGGYVYTARLDTVVEFSGYVYALEHKTTAASAVGRLFQRMSMDTQATGQAFLLDQLFETTKPKQGILINALVKRVARGKPPCLRHPVNYTQAHFKKFRLDVISTLQKIDEACEKYEDLLNGGMDHNEAASQVFVQHTGQCVGFGPCTFLPICQNIGSEDSMATNLRAKKINRPNEETASA